MSPSTSSRSTALSFYTAVAESPNNAEYDTTNISSPAEPPASEYRDARELPYELKSRVKIFLEEKMYLAGIQLLSSLLSPGGSRSRPSAPSTWVPPPAQIGMLNTLMIHPAYTSRAAEREDAQISTLASKYLRDLLTVAGPIHAGLWAAFDFHSTQRGARRGQVAPAAAPEEDEGLYDENSLNARLAKDGSLWTRGQEFWRVVGWAFNCSALHPHRWRYWKPWLEYMLDVLEADFDERTRLDHEAHQRAGGDGECNYQHLRGSLMMAYLGSCDNRGGLRQICKALVADGSPTSSLLFLEVFDKETKKMPSSTPTKRKRAVLDLENDKFGDYFDDESLPSSQVSDSASPLKARSSNRTTSSSKPKTSPPLTPGMRESVPLRLRLFYRLAWAALRLPGRFVELCDIYVTFADAVRELPAPFFALFVSTASSILPSDSLSTLLRHILPHYLPSSVPDPADVVEDDEDDDVEYGISMPMLQCCFLPYAANSVSVDANAKMSLVLESLLRLVWEKCGISWTSELQTVVEKGIAARNAKTKPRKNARAKADGDDQLARKMLTDSSQRLLTIMRIIKSG